MPIKRRWTAEKTPEVLLKALEDARNEPTPMPDFDTSGMSRSERMRAMRDRGDPNAEIKSWGRTHHGMGPDMMAHAHKLAVAAGYGSLEGVYSEDRELAEEIVADTYRFFEENRTMAFPTE